MISIVTVRVPGTYLVILLFPETLSPMGLAAPIDPLLSAIICMGSIIGNSKDPPTEDRIRERETSFLGEQPFPPQDPA